MIQLDPLTWYQATANPARVRERLEGATRVDVCIIGAGFTGLSAALHLARAGRKVLLLESYSVGNGASGRNGGQAIVGYRTDATDLVDHFGVDQAKRLFALAVEARDHLFGLIADEGIACDARRGHLHVTTKAREIDALKREAQCLTDVMGYPDLRLLDTAQVREAVASPAYIAGLLDPHGGQVHALNLCLGLADAAERAGARICEATPVDRIKDGVIHTGLGQVRAETIVLAADCWVDKLLPKLASSQMPVINYQIATRSLGKAAAQALIPCSAAVSDTKFVVDYYRMTHDHCLLFGGGERYSPRAPIDPASFVRRYMLKVFPQLAGTRIDYCWGGGVSITRTRYPHVGREGNIIYAHGYSGMGVIWAPFLGKLIAEAVCGAQERFDLIGSLPRQPFPGGALLRHPLYVLGMLWYALRDRL
jgi:gamma-glutamylputrescine oxidase